MSEVLFGILLIVSWFTSIIYDAVQDNIAWLIADILVFPIGVIRGVYIMFGGS